MVTSFYLPFLFLPPLSSQQLLALQGFSSPSGNPPPKSGVRTIPSLGDSFFPVILGRGSLVRISFHTIVQTVNDRSSARAKLCQARSGRPVSPLLRYLLSPLFVASGRSFRAFPCAIRRGPPYHQRPASCSFPLPREPCAGFPHSDASWPRRQEALPSSF